MTTSYAINDSLFLVHETIDTSTEPKKAAAGPTNHILVIDCSGSMYYDLPRIREQCKKKLPKLLNENDTVSIVWFSGRGQFGTLIEGEKVASLTDLQAVNGAIDRWLNVVGLTGFKEPLVEVKALTERVNKTNPGAFSLFFMSDGCDNQWDRGQILQAVEDAAPNLSAATFVEYGYYADRPMLTAMAEKAGGTLIFSDSFDKYDAVFDATMKKQVVGGKKVEITLPNADFVGGFAFALDQGDLYTFSIENGKISVPDGLGEVFFLSPAAVGKKSANNMEYISKVCWQTPAATNEPSPIYFDAVYAAISLFATRMKSDIVRPLLKASGDVAMIEQFANCFGKQAYSDFMDTAKAAAFKAGGRFTTGWDPNKVPKDDAFTVLGMLRLLASDDDNRVHFNHPSFSYSRIGRGRTDANKVLTKADHEEIEKLTKELATIKDPGEAVKISARIQEITDKPPALTFTEDATKAAEGYSISNLTYNENRPNISVLVRKEGIVDLSSRKDKPKSVPTSFPTFIFRNYTVIKDGLVNVATLPMKLTADSRAEIEKLVADGDIPVGAVQVDNGIHLIHLDKLPVINALMVKETSAKALFTSQYAMLHAKGEQKVYNSFKKNLGIEKKSEGFVDTYGEDAAAWLKEQGFTDYSGFSPKSVSAESTDYYMGKELKVKLKGLSSLPTLAKVQEGITKGKLTASAELMSSTVTEVEKYLDGKSDTDDVKAETAEWLTEKAAEATKEARRHMFNMANTKFAIVVGQTWFTEFSSLDEDTLDVTMPDGKTITGTVEMKEVKINI